MIYLFRPGRLQQDLSREEARTILKENGYEHTPHEFCIRRLIDRICHSQDFPHEIGLFLGYSPEDVRGFIDCRGKGCKSCGYWKVYGDKEAAEKQFDRFTKCTQVYLKCMQRGVPLQKLTVKERGLSH